MLIPVLQNQTVLPFTQSNINVKIELNLGIEIETKNEYEYGEKGKK